MPFGQELFEKSAVVYSIPDIIHAPNGIHGEVIANAVKAYYVIPFVLTEYSSAYLSGCVREWQVRVVTEVVKHSGAWFAVSRCLGHALERQFGPITQLRRWIPNVLGATFEEQNSLEGFGQPERVKYES